MLKGNEQILVLGTADWNQPIATNQHYMVRELAREYTTTFVESLGLRRPEFNSRDLKRMLKRLTGARASATERLIPTNVSIISPKIVPLHNFPWKILNGRILGTYFGIWSRSDWPIFWTYSPVTYGFEATARTSVYHCVDLYAEFPGIDGELIDREERRLAGTDIIAAGSSQVVVEHLKKQGFKDVLYWPNVADTEIIRQSLPESSSDRAGALFAGNLSEKKVDFGLLGSLLDAGIDLHLAGPVAEGGGESQGLLDDLISRGARYHGVVSLPDLSKLMARCKVGLIPYLVTPYTLGVSPLKTYEYLAAGLAVVSTPIPGVKPAPPDIFIESEASAFTRRVGIEAAKPIETHISRRNDLADKHSWIGRGEAARALLREARRKV